MDNKATLEYPSKVVIIFWKRLYIIYVSQLMDNMNFPLKRDLKKTENDIIVSLVCNHTFNSKLRFYDHRSARNWRFESVKATSLL